MVTPVLLPGMDGTGTLLQPLLAHLRAAIRPIVVTPAQRALDYNALESLAAQAFPHGDTYLLLGESFSGPIALSLAAKQPPGARNPRPLASKMVPLLLPLVPLKRPPPVLLKTLSLGPWSRTN